MGLVGNVAGMLGETYLREDGAGKVTPVVVLPAYDDYSGDFGSLADWFEAAALVAMSGAVVQEASGGEDSVGSRVSGEAGHAGPQREEEGGYCYLPFFEPGCRERVAVALGAWPTVSELFAMANAGALVDESALAQYGLVQVGQSKMHVVAGVSAGDVMPVVDAVAQVREALYHGRAIPLMGMRVGGLVDGPIDAPGLDAYRVMRESTLSGVGEVLLPSSCLLGAGVCGGAVGASVPGGAVVAVDRSSDACGVSDCRAVEQLAPVGVGGSVSALRGWQFGAAATASEVDSSSDSGLGAYWRGREFDVGSDGESSNSSLPSRGSFEIRGGCAPTCGCMYGDSCCCGGGGAEARRLRSLSVKSSGVGSVVFPDGEVSAGVAAGALAGQPGYCWLVMLGEQYRSVAAGFLGEWPTWQDLGGLPGAWFELGRRFVLRGGLACASHVELAGIGDSKQQVFCCDDFLGMSRYEMRLLGNTGVTGKCVVGGAVAGAVVAADPWCQLLVSAQVLSVEELCEAVRGSVMRVLSSASALLSNDDKRLLRAFHTLGDSALTMEVSLRSFRANVTAQACQELRGTVTNNSFLTAKFSISQFRQHFHGGVAVGVLPARVGGSAMEGLIGFVYVAGGQPAVARLCDYMGVFDGTPVGRSGSGAGVGTAEYLYQSYGLS